MAMRRAECACGQLSATCTGEPVRVSVCHCLACKRRTGSAFSWNARWARANVIVEGRTAEFTRIGDEGGRSTGSFCPDCGTTLYYRVDAQPDLIAIAAGGFADPKFSAPEYSSYDPSRRCDWVEIRVEDLERFD
ncbi:MAG TPA: GFA family protein [Phenylobacterium sp.]|jgi:hypothetical protein|uniref:GFA family protein n=1 Tax=Phenylobacterium sp. TaxID=1871053 RepID=UPI002D31B584|nr:GFA family protein [Phenylobacterium sp.]HZZ68499.1 GFA family protein [Phenylobacterium sp.]